MYPRRTNKERQFGPLAGIDGLTSDGGLQVSPLHSSSTDTRAVHRAFLLRLRARNLGSGSRSLRDGRRRTRMKAFRCYLPRRSLSIGGFGQPADYTAPGNERTGAPPLAL
jgi:hypothetical protein